MIWMALAVGGLAGLAPAAAAQVPSAQEVSLSARDAEGLMRVERACAVQHLQRWLVPLLSRSERVTRVVADHRGLGFRIDAAALAVGAGLAPPRLESLSIRAFQHPLASQLLFEEGDLRCVDAPLLVRQARVLGSGEPSDVLPLLARLDGQFLTLREGERLELLLQEGAPGALRVWRLGEDGNVLPDPRSSVDQLFQAAELPLSSLESRELRVIEPRGGTISAADFAARAADFDGALEFFVEVPPPAAAQNTWTLLLEAELQPHSPTRASSGLPKPASEASRRGITMLHLEGPDLQLDIRPTMGPGLAAGDADGDGWVDLYLPQGGGRGGSAAPLDRFYRNSGTGGFVDATQASGLVEERASMGALFFDGEGDGDLDLYVANYGLDRLFENDGRAHFADVSTAAGLAGDRWHAGVAAGDVDGDGDLEVYVTSYLDFAAPIPEEELGSMQREDPLLMLPFAFPGQPNSFYWNLSEAGALRFEDRAAALGLDDASGRGMQPIFWDYDCDGDPDLYVANDVSPNQLFENQGNGSFKNVSFGSGLDDPRGSMGLAVGDIDGDLDGDLFVSNWQLESNALYVNHRVATRSQRARVGSFHDEIVGRRLAQASVGVTSWGAELVDLDNDGALDLAYANGYTSPDYESTGICVGQPCHLYRGDRDGRFTRVLDREWLRLNFAHRALLACDFDQDGGLELAITSNNGPFRLISSPLGESRGHWSLVRLESHTRNTRAIGARVKLLADGRWFEQELRAGTSYLAGNAPELHFGLGAVEALEAIEVRWPSGRLSRHTDLALDRLLTLEEPE